MGKFGTFFPIQLMWFRRSEDLEEMQTMSWLIAEQYAYDHLVEARDFYLLNLGE
jgi:hypothetical protein